LISDPSNPTVLPKYTLTERGISLLLYYWAISCFTECYLSLLHYR